MLELVDMLSLDGSALAREGSSPSVGTKHRNNAKVVKLVDTLHSKCSALKLVGSSPTFRTKQL